MTIEPEDVLRVNVKLKREQKKPAEGNVVDESESIRPPTTASSGEFDADVFTKRLSDNPKRNLFEL